VCDLHPYAGIVRVRSEGLISACNVQAPLEKQSAFRVQSYEKTLYAQRNAALSLPKGR
jgi:hypothetical protein